MTRWVYDTESNELLRKATRMWIIAAYNLNTKKMHYWLEGDESWKEEFSKATLMVGHNICAFDNILLKKLFDFEFPKTCDFVDTLILSEILDYRRFGEEGHSLKRWGKELEDYKLEHEDWSQYSEKMKARCLQDVLLTVKVYNILIEEYKKLKEKNPQIRTYILAEQAVAKWCGLATMYGWPFDLEAAKALSHKLEGEMLNVKDKLEAKLGKKVVPIDKEAGEIIPKKMKFNKDGTYNAHMAAYFNVEPIEGLLEVEEREINFGGEFCRIKIEDLKLSSSNDVKIFLKRHGWVPTEWNYKKNKAGNYMYEIVNKKRVKIKTSPKVTEDSLEILGGDGVLYPEYLTARSRHGILSTWIEETVDGRLHGECKSIGTPSMRARHSIIVNVPSAESPWGKEMRSLFKTEPGWKLIGCDSEGNQARGLAHYLKDPTFIDTLLNGDIHTYNAQKIEAALNKLYIPWNPSVDFDEKELQAFARDWLKETNNNAKEYEDVSEQTQERIKEELRIKLRKKAKRAVAKRILYAFLFGASGAKLWSYVFGNLDQDRGNKFKTLFMQAVPGFEDLLDWLENTYGKTKQYTNVYSGYFYSIAGNRIYVDSFHKLLVYLLQSCEKITCATACMLLMKWLDEENIPYKPCIMMHDELDFLVPEEYAERAAELGKKAFAEGPKLYGIQIMNGSGKIGNDWYEVH